MVTINTSPSGTPSVQDNLWHVVTSDNSGQTDFKYVFDVWINGEQKIRVKQYPEPSNGKAYFDAGPTVRNEMTYTWFVPDNSGAYIHEANVSGEMGISYALRVGEDYSGVTTANLASGITQAYNWCPPLFKRRVYGLSDKVNKWLTNRPLTAHAKLGENLFVPFYANANIALRLDRFDYSNNLIGSTVSGSTTTIDSGFWQMNIGSTALENELSTTIDETVKYYEVWFNSLDKLRVYTECAPKYEVFLIHFLNRWGMWDTQRFGLVSRLTKEVERKAFSQKDYNLNGNSVDYLSGTKYYESKINYSNKADYTYKMTADVFSDDEFTWLGDLIDSPQILMETDGYYYPVTIKDSSYEYSKFINNKLRPLEIEFELNLPRYSHLR